ncbi:transcription factor like protein [Caulobacter sp. AP07]|uniref:type II toxin-antitoxin system VapB family antitoxin n=1 Tax=Caulobacter sp. AP07 TaxID=1144304 RepID=UPI000271ED27|nr:type II toxin-antitoxin system VapB family antitoxin [Caulobacter sp. AP07]EJL38424.1 transcription factor like protein [Caulobacter sp. AP07]
MAIHVANPEVCALVKLFAKERGVSMSEAVKIAVREALAARDEPVSAMKADIAAIDIEPA